MKKLLLSIATATLIMAQTPATEKRAEFEVASVKPTATKDGSFTWDFLPGGRFSGRNLTIHNLLRIAYDLQDHQISGEPGWISSEGDIQARPAEGAGDLPREQVRQMVQSLLADRFHLAVHRETRQLPVYALVVGKTGHKLEPADTSANHRQQQLRMGQLITPKMSMKSLAEILTFDLKRPVRDDTALKGEFAFTLEWTKGLGESDTAPSSGPSLFTAVQEQLGLKLEAAKGSVEVLVIDYVEKPSEN